MSLEATNIAAGYGSIQALWGVDLRIAEGEAVVLLGANGAGKTTLLRSLIGLLPLRSGQIRFFGDRIDGLPPHQRVQAGISFMSETGVFPGLTVEDNVWLGGHGLPKPVVRDRLDRIWMRFPELRRRRRQAADTLSGGQRKILGVARAMIREPRLLIMDEPSSGLSPLAVNELVETLTRVRHQDHATLLLAEQNIKFLRLADRAYVLEGGQTRFHGTVADFERSADIQEAFFGLSRAGGSPASHRRGPTGPTSRAPTGHPIIGDGV